MQIRPRLALACLVFAAAAIGVCLWAALTRETLPLSDRSERIPPRFKLTDENLNELQQLGVPDVVLIDLVKIKDVNFADEKAFRDRLQEVLPAETYAKYGDAVVQGTQQSDLHFYRSILVRVEGGQNYYDALSAEFRHLNFESRSVFNWRTPTYAWVMGKWLTPRIAQVILCVLALATFLVWFAVAQRELGTASAPLVILLIGPLAWCALDHIFVFTEVWAGTLIALSIGAYALRCWPVALTAGLIALLFRELTLPYCLLCLAVSLIERRWLESVLWCAGLALFGLYFTWHIGQVAGHLAQDGGVQAASWIRFGGLPFMIGTSQMNIFLISFPSWIAAALLPLSLLGMLGWPPRTRILLLLTSVGYLAAFAVVGMPNNAYWGLMITPLLALGWVGLPAFVMGLARGLKPPVADAT